MIASLWPSPIRRTHDPLCDPPPARAGFGAGGRGTGGFGAHVSRASFAIRMADPYIIGASGGAGRRRLPSESSSSRRYALFGFSANGAARLCGRGVDAWPWCICARAIAIGAVPTASRLLLAGFAVGTMLDQPLPISSRSSTPTPPIRPRASLLAWLHGSQSASRQWPQLGVILLQSCSLASPGSRLIH